MQAGTLDPAKALAEAYRRNNAGSYAESAEYFASVTQGESGASGKAEALANEALQKSNLGRFAELHRARLCRVQRDLAGVVARHVHPAGPAEHAGMRVMFDAIEETPPTA